VKNIGRNDPCPCGSGKKYKKCCGKVDKSSSEEQAEYKQLNFDFNISRIISYKGKIGKMREDFCKRQIEIKKLRLKGIEAEYTGEAFKRSAKISCQKGCSYCCRAYTEATIQECEAIAFFLYQNEEILNPFVKTYPQWKEMVHEQGDVSKNLEEIMHQAKATAAYGEEREAIEKAVNDELRRYSIPCPFLSNDICSIYEVRPYVCAGYFTFNAPDKCKDYFVTKTTAERMELAAGSKDIGRVVIPEAIVDHSFYYGTLTSHIWVHLPEGVYNILEQGYKYLSEVTHMPDLLEQVIKDPEIRDALRSFNKST